MPLSTGIGLSLANIPLIGGGGFVGLLDAYTSDLQVAVLPFRGFSSYTGQWCRIRESGGDTEQDIGYDSDGQPDTAEWQAFVGANSGFLRTWYDQSGDGRDLIQATTPAQQPLSILGEVNDFPVARFDGSDDIFGTTAVETNVSRSLYVVMRKRSPQVGAALKYATTLTSSFASFILDNTGAVPLNGGFGWRGSGLSTEIPLGGTVTDWSLGVFVAVDETVGAGYINNNAGAAIDPAGVVASATSILLGANSACADVDIAAVLLYNTAHDDTTRQAIQSILAAQFGITLA